MFLPFNRAAKPALPPPAVDGVRAQVYPLMHAGVGMKRLIWHVFRRCFHIP